VSARAALRRLVVATLAAVAVAAGDGALPTGPPYPGHDHAWAADQPAARTQLWTCGMHPQVIRDAPGLCPICHMELTPLVADEGGGAGAITIDPVVVQNMGVRTSAARRGPLARSIRAVGYLDEAEPRIHDVNLRVSGWVERLHADTVGMHVAAGDPLFDLYSPELHVAVEELIVGRRSAAGPASAALTEASRRKLERFGLGREQIDRLARLDAAPRTVTIASPITGHVTEKAIVAGAAVTAGDRVLQIVDHSLLWLDVQVFARDLPAVALGQSVSATVEGLGDRTFEGKVIFVHPHVDPTTRTATVRTSVPNPDMALRVGMYAAARIQVPVAEDAVLVPREAVIDTGTRQLAFVARDGGRFEPRTLTVGAAGDDGSVQILAGVVPGEHVVTSGQFLLDAESRLREAVQKHLQGDAGAAAPDAAPPAHGHP
jgi:multidrug efflux pump subunit AcrA (membrane-fusion protein)